MKSLVLLVLLTCCMGGKIHAQSQVSLPDHALVLSGIPEFSKSSHVQFPAGTFESESTTVEMWVRTIGAGGNRCVYAAKTAEGHTRMSLHISSNNVMGIWNGEGWQYIFTPVAFDTWMHVAFAVTSESTSVYVNGALRGIIPLGMRTYVTNTIPRIGVTGDDFSTEAWRGGIDEIRIWETVRTADQIQGDMNDRSTSNAPGLLGYYDCNQGTPNGDNKYITALTDRSPAQRNGTLTNIKGVPFSYSNFVAYGNAPLIPPFTGTVLFVNGSVTQGGDGSSWQSPYTSVADALAVVNGALQTVSIYVAKGTYTPGSERSETFAITRDGISLYGGYAGNETDLTVRDPRYNETILSGDIGLPEEINDNSLHVLSIVSKGTPITGATKIDGFTISHGFASGGESEVGEKFLDGHSGAAIVIDGSMMGNRCSPVISNCVISNNASLGYADDSEMPPMYGNGGAVLIDARNQGIAGPQFLNTVFTGTCADITNGGVMAILGREATTEVTVANCVFNRNVGGNDLIHHDAFFGTSNLNFINNTVFDNKQVNFIHSYTRGYQGSINLTNNILLYGAVRLLDEETLSGSPVQNFTQNNNIIEFGNSDNGNIATNDFDFFRNPFDAIGPDGIWRTVDDGLSLKGCGLALNSGDNNVATATDFKGGSRINQTTIDRGAYEGVPTTIVLSTPLVNNLPFVAEGCQGEIFTPYAIPGQPGNLSLAIAWGQNNLARNSAIVSVNTEAKNSINTAIGKGTAAMRRYWNVELFGAQLNDPVSLRFYYDAADTIAMKEALDGIGAASQVKWVKTNGRRYLPSEINPASEFNPDLTWLTPSASGVENGIAYVEFSGITSFSGGGAVVTADAVLPVRITELKAKAKDCAVQLDWSVADAVNFKGYEVERSANGGAYAQVGKIAHNSGKNTYSFTDASVAGSGKCQYRLKLVDIDGKFVYSDVLAVESSCNGVLSRIVIAPNPVRSELNIQFNADAKNAVVNIRSMAGTLISSTKVVHSTKIVKIPVASLHAGVYLVELNTASGKTVTQKIIKQ